MTVDVLLQPPVSLQLVDLHIHGGHLLAPVQCSVLQYSTVQYSTVQYSTVQYSTVQYTIMWRFHSPGVGVGLVAVGAVEDVG